MDDVLGHGVETAKRDVAMMRDTGGGPRQGGPEEMLYPLSFSLWRRKPGVNCSHTRKFSGADWSIGLNVMRPRFYPSRLIHPHGAEPDTRRRHDMWSDRVQTLPAAIREALRPDTIEYFHGVVSRGRWSSVMVGYANISEESGAPGGPSSAPLSSATLETLAQDPGAEVWGRLSQDY